MLEPRFCGYSPTWRFQFPFLIDVETCMQVTRLYKGKEHVEVEYTVSLINDLLPYEFSFLELPLKVKAIILEGSLRLLVYHLSASDPHLIFGAKCQ